MTDAERHRLVLEGMLKDADFEVAAAHTTFARYGPMSRSRIARLEAKALALAAAVAALRAQEEAGADVPVSKLKALIERGDTVDGIEVVYPHQLYAIIAEAEARVPAVPTGAQPDEATIQPTIRPTTTGARPCLTND